MQLHKFYSPKITNLATKMRHELLNNRRNYQRPEDIQFGFKLPDYLANRVFDHLVECEKRTNDHNGEEYLVPFGMNKLCKILSLMQ